MKAECLTIHCPTCAARLGGTMIGSPEEHDLRRYAHASGLAVMTGPHDIVIRDGACEVPCEECSCEGTKDRVLAMLRLFSSDATYQHEFNRNDGYGWVSGVPEELQP